MSIAQVSRQSVKTTGTVKHKVVKKAKKMPFQPRPEIPTSIMNFARQMHSEGFPIQKIVHAINTHNTSLFKIPQVKNFDYENVNYYDIWKYLGDNKRLSLSKRAS